MTPININFLTPYLVLNIIKLMFNNKALEHDKVTTIMLKNSSFKIVIQICYIIRLSMQLGYFPKVKQHLCHFQSRENLRSFQKIIRPISLFSVLSKIYEKIINIQIMKHLKSENIIINKQNL